MKKIYEYEKKCLISAKDFMNLINKYNYLEKEEQTNYYFDFNDFFKNKNQALRIRKINNDYELTLKTKKENHNTEINLKIDVSTFNYILKNLILTNDLAKKLNLPKLKFNSLITIKTIRYKIKYNDYIIELDHNFFNQVIDYEIEVESTSIKEADKILTSFLKENNICFCPSKAKIARAISYLN